MKVKETTAEQVRRIQQREVTALREILILKEKLNEQRELLRYLRADLEDILRTEFEGKI